MTAWMDTRVEETIQALCAELSDKSINLEPKLRYLVKMAQGQQIEREIDQGRLRWCEQELATAHSMIKRLEEEVDWFRRSAARLRD